MLDLLIKNGQVADGAGAPLRIADVAVQDGRIVAVAPTIAEPAHETVDASGKLVTPGFIDVHTHYDGQATWDDRMLPSAAHGVTTVVMGSCGIGFAPVRKGSEDWLITLTEGVEDIPGSALHVGIPWGWETFPEYLDHLDSRQFALNVAAQVPHSAVRAYVLGERAVRDEPATDAELAEIGRIVREGIAAGAVGVGTSRVSMHRGSDGGVLPGTRAPKDELLAISRAIMEGGGGVLQMIPSGVTGGVEGQEGEATLAGLARHRDQYPLSAEVAMMRWLHRETGVPITFTIAESRALGDAEWQAARAQAAAAASAGERIYPQFSPRPTGGVLSLDGYHLFTARPTYREIAGLPAAERARRMADPAVRARILSEADIDPQSDDPFQHMHLTLARTLGSIFSLRDLDFEPDPAHSVAALAQAAGGEPQELFYDLLIEDDGQAVLVWMSTGYPGGDLRYKESCLADPACIVGNGDGGAHVRFICDSSYPTFLLSHWGRDRTRGRRFPVEALVRRMTAQPAELYGFRDRGVIAPGMRADLNVIDFERLSLRRPRMVSDLPAGAARYLQGASGYEATVVAGVVTRRRGEDTGARPGRLIRGI